ncbi:hypothetical protein [Amycolatopsis thermoflava]|uniref:hypothetical protein n=1 Tax=Amycolatopsis thermoflava TaxID=84480 RepID=UPI0038207D96
MAVTRVARTATAVLRHTFVVDETPTASTTTVTVSVTDANGTVVASGDAIAEDAGTYVFTLPSQAQLQVLTVGWSATIAGAAVVETDYVEIVGGFYFTLVEGRASDSSLADQAKYPTAALKAARLEVEIECEQICERAFVPRYGRAVLDGTGNEQIMLPDADVRTIRAVRVAPQVGQTFVALTALQLAALAVTADGMLERTDGVAWTEGRSNVIVEYEHGWDTPPQDLKEQALVRFRSLAAKHRTGIPDRAQSFTAVDGGTYRLSLPGRFATGIPDVDAVYSRYSRGAGAAGPGSKGSPAARTLNYDPQRGSLFHGGVR